MLLSEGQMSDYKGAALMIDALPQAKAMLGDRGYDADWFRAALAERGITKAAFGKWLEQGYGIWLADLDGSAAGFAVGCAAGSAAGCAAGTPPICTSISWHLPSRTDVRQLGQSVSRRLRLSTSIWRLRWSTMQSRQIGCWHVSHHKSSSRSLWCGHMG